MKDWKIFLGDGSQHDGLFEIPNPPPWRFSRPIKDMLLPVDSDIKREEKRATPFLPSEPMILAVNAALYLRRPLLVTGRAGTGKSTLISKVAYELKLGPVIRWPISSRSTVRSGIYEYDAVGRLQEVNLQKIKTAGLPVEDYLTLGPLGTALMAQTWPRALLIDELDKSDLDFANDLLNVIEEGIYEIPELRRLKKNEVWVRDYFGELAAVRNGRIESGQFPFVILTSNAEREFPSPFLRRCVRLNIEPPDKTRLAEIVESHLKHYSAKLNTEEIKLLIDEFDLRCKENKDVSTDQLLNAIFLTIAMPDASERSFSKDESDVLRRNLLRELSGPAA
jgi:MoxR-like ATPase